MIEELPDDIENDVLDDIEPVGDESQLYEHFRVVVDKGQEMVRVDKYLFDRRPMPRATVYRKLPMPDL
jgi:23S rRNA pseudouridine1911/1915/1917 synthase